MRLYPKPAYLGKMAMFRLGDVFLDRTKLDNFRQDDKNTISRFESQTKTDKSGTNLPDSI